MSKLVLLRHGESTWNLANRFTGWQDVPLSERGLQEAHDAAVMLREAGVAPDLLHTSLLLRAIQTAEICLQDMGRAWLPVARSWRLNERHYGALEGLNKSQTTQEYGEDQVKAWRRSFATPPPALESDDPRHPRHDSRYRDLPPDVLPAAESLRDVVVRMMPYWQDAVVRDLRLGRCVLVAAHGNSLRALVMHLHGLSEEEVVALNIPTGIPMVYEFDDNLQLPGIGRPEQHYLGDPAQAAAKAQAVAAQAAAGRPPS